MRIVSSDDRALVFKENPRRVLTAMTTTWSSTMMEAEVPTSRVIHGRLFHPSNSPLKNAFLSMIGSNRDEGLTLLHWRDIHTYLTYRGA